jgi:hypothetical protein
LVIASSPGSSHRNDTRPGNRRRRRRLGRHRNSGYTRDVSFATNAAGVGYASSKSYTLWDVTTLAPVLLVIAAAAGAGLVFASTVLDAGPFVGLVGGLLLVAGAVGLVGEAPEASASQRTPSATVEAAT